jgi:CheY-like chemotaxis protein
MSRASKVLVVIADDVRRFGFKGLLRSWGYRTAAAADSPEGLSRAQEFKPDIILCENPLIGGGVEFLQLAQADDPTVGLFLVNEGADDPTKSIQVGIINTFLSAQGYHILKAKLQAYLAGRKRLLRRFSPLSSARILIVEDEENERAGLAELIEQWGYQVETARNGLEGLEKIRPFKPDIILTDVKMPLMDGLELLEKAHPKYPQIGFFLVTAAGSIDSAVRAIKLGAVSYVSKPISTDGLRADLQAYLDGRQPPLRAFLCHAAEDKAIVRKLQRRLERDGIDPWIDDKQLTPGQNWELEIRNAIRRSDVVVVCLSRGSVSKHGFVQKELRMALDVSEEKPDGAIFLIPTRLDDCDVPHRLRQWQWVNLFETKGYRSLLNALRRRAGAVLLNPSDLTQEIRESSTP